MTRAALPVQGRLLALIVGSLVASGCALVAPGSRLTAVPEALVRTASARTPTSPAAAGVTLAPGRDPGPAGVRLRPRPRKGAFRMDLYDRGDHVAQYTASWCVGASMQMMINIIEEGRPDRTRRTQEELYDLAREVSPWVERRPGASTVGWAGGLTELGHGPYGELAAAGRQEALRIAARQMRHTRKPVGLLVWRGRHAWVMSGFRATADPAWTDGFEVTHVYIEDPWSGRTSPTWGPGLDPHALVRADRLSGFTRWASRFRPEYGRKGRYVIVAPLLEETADGLAPIAATPAAPA